MKGLLAATALSLTIAATSATADGYSDPVVTPPVIAADAVAGSSLSGTGIVILLTIVTLAAALD